MDTNTSIIIINLIINLLVVLDHFINRIKSSKCWGASLEMNDAKNNELDNNKILEQLKELNKKPNDKKDDKPNDKPDDAINKL